MITSQIRDNEGAVISFIRLNAIKEKWQHSVLSANRFPAVQR